jgi:UDP-glucose 4-epimerase
MSVVLVSGVSRHLGSSFARILDADPGIERVVGVDVVPPRADIGGAEFVRADIRNPIIAKVIAAAGADIVVHMGVISTPLQAGGRLTMKEVNVIGTMQLLAACQKSSTVRKLVVKSTSSVYGAGPKDPAKFTEDTEPRSQPRAGWAKDSVEVEGYVRGFARRRPDVTVTTLRFANVLGPYVETTMSTYFGLPLLPTVLGHDARMQFVHEDDLLETMRLAVVGDQPGTYNVAGDGVLMLSQAARLAGRQVLPVPTSMVGLVGGWLRRSGFADFTSEQVRFLTYGRALDTHRLTERFGFTPRYTTRETFESFVAQRLVDRTLPRERIVAFEQGVAHAFGRKTAGEHADAVAAHEQEVRHG